ncbi:hypothetical protein O9H85_01200 [Paenibacillus filicis]|uniref:Uncharacterized protein n=1 Tax=Paenibacillus gyeongsangnamensis TaxID=3388067 RepID=A0ABT4Q2T0_9BACL|nr:hypothetical protein [Paenibacillus filicis]MCZ8511072.1 hypothetical protein [Paenibacillus filicis]
MERLFGRRPGKAAYAWTSLQTDRLGGSAVRLRGESSAICVDGRTAATASAL